MSIRRALKRQPSRTTTARVDQAAYPSRTVSLCIWEPISLPPALYLPWKPQSQKSRQFPFPFPLFFLLCPWNHPSILCRASIIAHNTLIQNLEGLESQWYSWKLTFIVLLQLFISWFSNICLCRDLSLNYLNGSIPP